MQEMRTYVDPAAPPGTRCPRCDSDYVTPSHGGVHACKQCGERFQANGMPAMEKSDLSGGNRHERRRAAALARKQR